MIQSPVELSKYLQVNKVGSFMCCAYEEITLYLGKRICFGPRGEFFPKLLAKLVLYVILTDPVLRPTLLKSLVHEEKPWKGILGRIGNGSLWELNGHSPDLLSEEH